MHTHALIMLAAARPRAFKTDSDAGRAEEAEAAANVMPNSSGAPPACWSRPSSRLRCSSPPVSQSLRCNGSWPVAVRSEVVVVGRTTYRVPYWYILPPALGSLLCPCAPSCTQSEAARSLGCPLLFAAGAGCTQHHPLLRDAPFASRTPLRLASRDGCARLRPRRGASSWSRPRSSRRW